MSDSMPIAVDEWTLLGTYYHPQHLIVIADAFLERSEGQTYRKVGAQSYRSKG